jgi:hypothetical protein
MEKVPKNILRSRKQPPVPKIEFSKSKAKIEKDPTYTLYTNELSGPYLQEA